MNTNISDDDIDINLIDELTLAEYGARLKAIQAASRERRIDLTTAEQQIDECRAWLAATVRVPS